MLAFHPQAYLVKKKKKRTGILARETETTEETMVDPPFFRNKCHGLKNPKKIPQQNSPSATWRCFFFFRKNRPRCREPNSVRRKVSFPSTFVGLGKTPQVRTRRQRATVFRSWWLKLNQPGRKLYKICSETTWILFPGIGVNIKINR